MSLTIRQELYNLNDFNFWGGAVSRYEEIKELGAENEIMDIIAEQYSDGMTEAELNDFVWFELDDFIEEMQENLND